MGDRTCVFFTPDDTYATPAPMIGYIASDPMITLFFQKLDGTYAEPAMFSITGVGATCAFTVIGVAGATYSITDACAAQDQRFRSL